MIHVTSWDKMESEALSPVISRRMLSGKYGTIARFHLRKGALVPRHAHRSEQFSTVLSGSLKFIFDDREVVLHPGDVLFIPSDVPHAAEALEDTDDFDVFAPCRKDWGPGQRGDSYLRGAARR